MKDNSGPFMLRRRILFSNGYQLSVIRGSFSYTGEHELEFEIAVIDQDGGWATNDFFPEHSGNVIPHVSLENIMELITRIGDQPCLQL